MRHTRDVTADREATRRTSAAVFGNEKTVEVVLALVAANGLARATDIVQSTGIAHGMVRPVLKRLLDAGALSAMPRRGGTRGELYFEIADDGLWRSIAATAAYIAPQTNVAGTPAPVAASVATEGWTG